MQRNDQSETGLTREGGRQWPQTLAAQGSSRLEAAFCGFDFLSTQDAGFDSVLVGHSERRAGFGGQAVSLRLLAETLAAPACSLASEAAEHAWNGGAGRGGLCGRSQGQARRG